MKRVELRMLTPPPALLPCTECGQCCTYVGIGINAPTTPRFATDILWYLYHERLYVYRDGDRFDLPSLTRPIAVDEIYDDLLDVDGRSLLR